jgi:AbiV family abortive infection protein
MPVIVTPQYLLEGAVYSLEQCGLLLRDANILYRSGSYANAVVLAAFAREELGRFKILLDLRRQVVAGKEFTVKQIRKRCEKHVVKQTAGMLSIVQRTDRDSELGRLLQIRTRANPQSEEWKKVDAEVAKITEQQRKRTPQMRHDQRISALYVQPNAGSKSWNRPVTTSPSAAHDFLNDAVNDYSGQYSQRYISSADPILKHIDPELYNALEQWTDRPELQPPEWPPLYAGS